MPDPGTPPTPAAAQVPTPTPVQQTAPPNPAAAESETNEEVAAAPAMATDGGVPPVSSPPVLIDVHLPPLGDKSGPPAVEPPNIDVVQAVPDSSIAEKPEQPSLQVNEDLYPKPTGLAPGAWSSSFGMSAARISLPA